MRNEFNPKIRTIFSLAKKLPYFDFGDLSSVETNKSYLKILFSRYTKSGKVIRLKKGIYVAKEYIDEIKKSDGFSCYTEFIANILYQPSYLSLDYVLYQHNLLTEIPVNFTSVTKNKTISFANNFGNFFYHKIRDGLFCGFEPTKEKDFTILRATKAKAIFDYLYFRKNNLVSKQAVEELRLNIENINRRDKKELEKYIKMEGSKKMEEIFSHLFK